MFSEYHRGILKSPMLPDRCQRRDRKLSPAWSSPLQLHDPLFPSLRLFCCQAGKHWIFFLWWAQNFSSDGLKVKTKPQVMEDSFEFVPPTSVLAPAIMAVAAVNVIIVAYVIKAFRWKLFGCFIMKSELCCSHCSLVQGRECKREEQDWMKEENFFEKIWNCDFCDLVYW